MNTGSSVIAVGTGGDLLAIKVWTSADGESWTTANGPTPLNEDSVHSAASDGRRIVLLASTSTVENGSDRVLTWTSTLSP